MGGKVQAEVEGELPGRDRRGGQADGGGVQAGVPPMLLARGQRLPDFAQHAGILVDGITGLLPIGQGQGESVCVSWLLRMAAYVRRMRSRSRPYD